MRMRIVDLINHKPSKERQTLSVVNKIMFLPVNFNYNDRILRGTSGRNLR